MGISLQEGNSSHPESGMRGLSKAKPEKNSWIVYYRNWKKNRFSLEERYRVSSLGCICHWVKIMVSHLIFTYPIKGAFIKYFVHHAKFKYRVMWLMLKIIHLMSDVFTWIFIGSFLGCAPTIKWLWKSLCAKHLHNHFLNYWG